MNNQEKPNTTPQGETLGAATGSTIINPTYYVRHPDGSYSEANPQPSKRDTDRLDWLENSETSIGFNVEICMWGVDFEAPYGKTIRDAIDAGMEKIEHRTHLSNDQIQLSASGADGCNTTKLRPEGD